jgi:hypothetical protein
MAHLGRFRDVYGISVWETNQMGNYRKNVHNSNFKEKKKNKLGLNQNRALTNNFYWKFTREHVVIVVDNENFFCRGGYWLCSFTFLFGLLIKRPTLPILAGIRLLFSGVSHSHSHSHCSLLCYK